MRRTGRGDIIDGTTVTAAKEDAVTHEERRVQWKSMQSVSIVHATATRSERKNTRKPLRRTPERATVPVEASTSR